MAQALTLTAVTVYPVKGCRGIALESGVVTPTGLLFDRNWVIVKEAGGRFVTQRQQPKLALVETSVVPDALLQGSDSAAHPDACLVLRAPGMPAELRVPLTPPPGSPARPRVTVTVWEWTGEAVDEGDAAAAWLTSYLGFPARLARYAGTPGLGGPAAVAADPARRPVAHMWWTSPAGAEVAMSDQFPFLMANEASLASLNAQLAGKGEGPLPMNRFRPNLVVAGAAAWAEDGWASIAVGGATPDAGVSFDCAKPCSRCKVTTIDQETGEESATGEPLVTLQEARSGRALGWLTPPEFKGSVFFAQNLIAHSQGVVRLGDAVRVTSERSGPPMPASA